MIHFPLFTTKSKFKPIRLFIIVILMLACQFSPGDEVADTLRDMADQVESSDQQKNEQTNEQDVQLGRDESTDQEESVLQGNPDEHVSPSALTEQDSQPTPNFIETKQSQLPPLADENYDYDPSQSCSEYFGKIVYARQHIGPEQQFSQLNIIDADGGNLIEFPTGDPIFSYMEYPAWSPNHCRIAFSGEDWSSTGNGDIYTTKPDGSDMVRLTDNPADDREPDWSPDGERIVFVSLRDGKNPGGVLKNHLYIMNADGTDQKLLSDHDDTIRAPEWSPDGRQIAFECNDPASRYKSGCQICVIDADGKNLKQLTPPDDSCYTFPSWSPDGKQIAIRTNRYVEHKLCLIAIMNADGSNMQLFPIDIPELETWQPKWSSDGTQMLVGVDSAADAEVGTIYYDLIIVDVDSGTYKYLFKTAKERELDADW